MREEARQAGDSVRGPAPLFILSVCGAAFLGNLGGARVPRPEVWLALCGAALACGAFGRSRWLARALPARLPCLVALLAAAGLRAALQSEGGRQERSPAAQAAGALAAGGEVGRWIPRATSFGETRGRLGYRGVPLHLPAGAARPGEIVAVRPVDGAVRRARAPEADEPEETPRAQERAHTPVPQSRDPAPVAWTKVAADELLRLGPSATKPFAEPLSTLRRAGLARARALRSERARILYRALVFGDRGGWPAEAADLFVRTGTRHVLSLSGLHVGLLAWLVALPLGSLAARAVAALAARAGRRALVSPALFQALLVWAFVPLAGANPPVVRAAWALTLARAARWVPVSQGPHGRRPLALALWAFALLLECLAHPGAPYEISVQLSYAATLGLILGFRGAQRLVSSLGPRRRTPPGSPWAGASLAPTTWTGRPVPPSLWIPVAAAARFGTSAVSASIAAVAGTLPFVWFHFGEWSPWGLLATPFVVVPLAAFLLSGLFFTVLPCELVRYAVERSASTLFDLLEVVDSMPETPSQLPPRPSTWLAFVGVVVLCALASRAVARRRWLERAAAALLGASFLPWVAAPRSFEIALLDVGHGTAVVARAPGEPCWIFDAGSRDRPAIGRDAIGPLLRRWDVAEISVVLSHGDRDHTSALPWLTHRFRVAAWAGAAYAGSGPRRVDIERGTVPLPTRSASLRARLLRGRPGDDNEGSRSLELEWEGARWLLCGDAEGAGLAALLRSGQLSAGARVVLLPHHGARSDELEALLRATGPEEVWVSRAPGTLPCERWLERLGIPWRSTAQGPLLGRSRDVRGPLERSGKPPSPPGPPEPAGAPRTGARRPETPGPRRGRLGAWRPPLDLAEPHNDENGSPAAAGGIR